MAKYLVKVGNFPTTTAANFDELLNILIRCKETRNKVVFKNAESERNITREVRTRYERLINPKQLSLKEYSDIMRYFRYECAYCGNSLFDQRLERDHVQPLSSYGLNRFDNVIPACRSCNASKNCKNYYAWYKEQEFFDRKRLAKIDAFLIKTQTKRGE